jgi:aspartyl-tRNA(Asn)/glutamyl-tRNA(Gln) amidotransferase subunit C
MNIDIPHIAKLAALRVEEGELAELQRDMAEIVQMLVHLPKVQEQVLPDAANAMMLREDVVVPSECTPQRLLQNAPQVHANCVVVPQTMQESES